MYASIEDEDGTTSRVDKVMTTIDQMNLTKEELLLLAARYAVLADAAIDGSINQRQRQAAKAANARHSRPGGSRDKAQQIRDIYAKGNFKTRTKCAEEEHDALGMSLSAAMKALRNTPKPT